MAYGTIKVDTVTFTDAGVDKSVTLSGLVQNPVFSGNVTVTGTLSGVTVTGTTANFTSGNFTNISGGTHTITSGVFAAGSAASPSITFTGDLNTGIYSPGADQVAISTGGSGRLFVDASGNIGIADSTPQRDAGTTSLAIGDGSKSASVDLYGTVKNYAIYNGGSGQLGVFDLSASTERITLTSAGLVGVGTSSPNCLLEVKGGSAITTLANSYTNCGVLHQYSSTSLLAIGNDGTSPILQGVNATNNTARNLLLNPLGGSVGIGTSSPSDPLHIAVSGANSANIRLQSGDGRTYNVGSTGSGYGSSGKFIIYDITAGAERFCINSSGNVGIGTTSPSISDWNPSSQVLHIYQNSVAGSALKVESSNAVGVFAAGSDLVAVGSISNDPLQFRVNVNEVGRFDTSGRLLVGTSTARSNYFNSTITADLQVESTNGIASIIRDTNTAGGPALILGKTRSASVGGTTIVQNGDLIGAVSFQSSDGSTFIAAASVEAYVDGTPGATDMPGRLVFSTTADGASSPTERMRIGNDGRVFVACTTSPSASVFGTMLSNDLLTEGNKSSVNTTSANVHWVFFNPNGAVGSIATSGSSTVFSTSSDYRLKENVKPITDGITRLQQLKPSQFNFIADPDETVDGFIAHEVQTVVPEAITGEKDGVGVDGNPIYQGIDQSKLVPLLTAALQETLAKIESLEARLTAAGI